MMRPRQKPDSAGAERAAPRTEASAVPLSRPDIAESDIQAVLDVLRTPHLSLGPKVPEFEAAFCAYTGARYATAASSGTAALHMAVKALDLRRGDEVITSPFSFVASANCALFVGAVPAFVDIDPVSFNLDPDLIERRISPRTKAILPVHVFGRPAQMDAILDIARRHRLYVIEDACEALGARWHGRHVGTLGDIGTFAFYPNKQITTGEGGMVVTNDPGLDRLFKSLRNQGRGGTGAWLQHERLGYNYRLADINCALGLAQLARVETILARRRAVADAYRRRLAIVEEVELPLYEAPDAEISWFVYVVRLKGFARVERDEVLRALRADGIACSDYFSPLHLQTHLRRLGYRPGDFPVTEAIAASTVALPFHNHLPDEDVDRVSATLRVAVGRVIAARAPHGVRHDAALRHDVEGV